MLCLVDVKFVYLVIFHFAPFERCRYIQSDQQETKSRVLPHLLFYRNVFPSWISRFYLLAVDTRFVGCLPLKNYH
jgi:hypothetical protein